MFDDPNKELKKLEDQLIQAEMTDDEFEAFYDELFEEFGPAQEPEEDLLAGSPVNKAHIQPKAQQSAPRKYQGSSAPAYGGSLDEKRSVAAPRKQKSLKGLVICACVECLAIVGVVLWWMLRIL